MFRAFLRIGPRSRFLDVGVVLCFLAVPAQANAQAAQAAQAAPVADAAGVAPQTLVVQPVAVVTPLGAPRSPATPSSASSTALLRGLYVSFSALQMLDAASTITALDHGAVEANLLMTGIASRPAALIAVKAATAASTIYLAERIARKSRWGAIVTMVALNSVYVLVVTHNYRVAGAMAAR